MKLILAVFVLMWLGLFVRVGYVQLVKWKYFEAEAQKQHWERLELNPRRGGIYDRQGRALTLDRSTCSIRVLPQYVRDGDAGKDTLAGILAGFGLGEKRDVLAELQARDRLFRLRRGVEYACAESLRRVLVARRFHNCTLVDDEDRRSYPYGPLCAGVVGFVGAERGLAGIEVRYDSVLGGQPGWVLLQRDAIGHCLPDPSYPRREPVSGSDIWLTLDVDVQEACFRALRDKVEETGAIGGSAVVLSALDGAVLALVDYPAYDPNRFGRYDQSRYRCRAVCDEFEPGSSFKPVFGVAALEGDNARDLLARTYDVSAGYFEVSGYKIHDVHNNGLLDFDGLFIESSNPGCAMLSLEVDREQFYLTARAMGFGNPVGIGMPGEGDGRIDRPGRLTRLRLANNAFGHGLTATLLQLAAAYLCIANEGVYIRPYLVESIRSPGGRVSYAGKNEVRRAMRIATARYMKEVLARVVSEGTGTAASVAGVQVCGKTGTATKVENGSYSKTKSRMSFVGFLPKDEPRYVVAVLVDEPQTDRFASSVSCPVFARIGERLLALERMRTRREAVGGDRVFELAGISLLGGLRP